MCKTSQTQRRGAECGIRVSGGGGGRCVCVGGSFCGSATEPGSWVEGGGGTTFLPTAKLPPQKHRVHVTTLPLPRPPHHPHVPSHTPLHSLPPLHVSRGPCTQAGEASSALPVSEPGEGWRARRQTGNSGLSCLQVEHVTRQRRTTRKTGAARGAELIKHLCSRLQPAGFRSEPSRLLSA